MKLLARIVLEIQQWLEDTLSKVIKRALPLAGLLVDLQCNNLVMAMDSLEHILAHHRSIMLPSLLIQAIPLNQHRVDIPPIGTSQLLHQLSRLPREVVMITMVSNNHHTNNKILVVLLHPLTMLVIIMASHLFQAIISKDKVILKKATVGIMHRLSLGMVSHHHMINSRDILQLAMVM